MNQKIKEFLDDIFKPYENPTYQQAGAKVINELKEELLANMQEKFEDLLKDGLSEESAYKKTVDSLGDISEIIDNISDQTSELHQRINWNLSMSNIKYSKLDSVDLKSGKFNYSNIANSDFHNSNLSNSSFKGSNLKNTNFEKADLCNSIFKYSNLEGCNFNSANLKSSQFIKSNLKGTSFNKAILEDTVFKSSELSWVNFEDMELIGVVFDNSGLKKTSFRNATLNNVRFKTDVRKTIFDGASMDKITYALLESNKADLKYVKIIN